MEILGFKFLTILALRR